MSFMVGNHLWHDSTHFHYAHIVTMFLMPSSLHNTAIFIIRCKSVKSETLPSSGYSYYYYGSVGGPIFQKHFQCRGTEEDLSQCDIYNISSRSHTQDAGIECYGMCKLDVTGALELVPQVPRLRDQC